MESDRVVVLDAGKVSELQLNLHNNKADSTTVPDSRIGHTPSLVGKERIFFLFPCQGSGPCVMQEWKRNFYDLHDHLVINL